MKKLVLSFLVVTSLAYAGDDGVDKPEGSLMKLDEFIPQDEAL